MTHPYRCEDFQHHSSLEAISCPTTTICIPANGQPLIAYNHFMPDTKRTLTITPSLAHLAEELRPLGLSLNDLLRLALWCNPTAESVAAHLSAADLPSGPSPRYAFRLPQTGWDRIAQFTEALRRQGRQGLSRSQVVRAMILYVERRSREQLGASS